VSVRSYIAEMPAGSTLLERYENEDESVLVLSDCNVPSSLYEILCQEAENLAPTDLSVIMMLLKPVVVEIVEWECRTALDRSEHFYEFSRIPAGIPEWGRSDVKGAAALIARAHEICDPDVVVAAEEACARTGAPVHSVLALALNQYWDIEDVEEFLQASAQALATRA
jgi:hypothetical protein